jgi:Uma2 family endonuclease
MTSLWVDDQGVRIPAWVTDLKSFREWVHSGEFPEKGRICYLNGEVWVDLSMEQFFTHNQVKNEFAFVLTGLIKAGRHGRYGPDGMLITNVEADISSEPDGSFVSRDALDSGRVRFIEGKREGILELEGTPDMVLEILSASSEEKDTVILRRQYWEAGIPEYWLVDVRREPQTFDILRRTARGYTPARKQDGWVRSNVFGKSFRLTCNTDERGDPEHTLEIN